MVVVDYDSLPACPSSLSGSFSTDGSSSMSPVLRDPSSSSSVVLLPPLSSALGGSGTSNGPAAPPAVRVIQLQRQLASRTQECDELREALHTMSQALQELHWEVRDKSRECEALQQTSVALSEALKESERQLHRAQCRNEHLEFKLSAVGCFYDPGDPAAHDESATARYRSSSLSGSQADSGHASHSHRGSSTVLSSHSYSKWRDAALGDLEDDLDAAVEDRIPPPVPIPGDVEASTSALPTQAPFATQSEPQTGGHGDEVAVPSTNASFNDGSSPAESSASHDSADSSSSSSPLMPSASADPGHPDNSGATPSAVPATATGAASELSSAPCQAAFYRVILERDQARRDAERLYKEVKARREQVRTLRARLSKSTALIELSYEDDNDANSRDDRDGSSHLSPLKWLKNTANSSNPIIGRKQSSGKGESNADKKVAATTMEAHPPAPTPYRLHAQLPSLEKYVDMMVNNDADKAAGSVHLHSSTSHASSSIRNPRVRKVVSQLVEL